MLLRTNMIAVISLLCILALCNAKETGWTPLLTAVAQRRYGSSSNIRNFVSTKRSSDGYQSSNDATTSKYQYGESRTKQEGPMLNYGTNVNTYKAAPSYISAGTISHQNGQGHSNVNLGILENQQQRPYHGMDVNMNAHNFADIQNSDHNVGYSTASNGDSLATNKQYEFGNVMKGLGSNFGGASMSYGDRGNYHNGGVDGLHVDYKGGSGYDAFAVTTYRGTSGTGESKGGDLGKPVILNYATRRPVSYDQFLQNKLLDPNRNPQYNINIENNGGSIGMAYDQNNNHHPPNYNNNNNGAVKGNDYTNNEGVNYGHVNSQTDNNASPFNTDNNKKHDYVFTMFAAGENTGSTSQNNNNNKNNGYRQGSPNDNLNVNPVGPLNNAERSTYAVDDNYIDGPPLDKPHAPQLHQHQAMLPTVNPPFSSIKQSQQHPQLQQYPRPSPDLKSYHPNSRPPMASEGYSTSSRPLLPGMPPTPIPMLTSTFLPQSPEKLPMKLLQSPHSPPSQQQQQQHPQHFQPQQQISPPQQVLRHPHQPLPEIQNPNQEIQQSPNAINDSFFLHLMRVISNTLFYGDFETRRH